MQQHQITQLFVPLVLAFTPLKAIDVEAHLPNDGFILGGPMPVQVVLKNDQSSPVRIMDIDYSVDSGSPSKQAGLVIFPLIPSCGGGLEIVEPTKPGDSVTKEFYLNRYISITAPGAYRVKISVYMVSNRAITKELPLIINVVPATEETIRDKINELASQIKPKNDGSYDKVMELMYFDNSYAVRLAGKIFSLSSNDFQQYMIQTAALNPKAGIAYLKEFSKTANNPSLKTSIAQKKAFLRAAEHLHATYPTFSKLPK